MSLRLPGSLGLLLALGLIALAPVGARAATIVPVTVSDVENGSIDDLGCTLRDAVQAANENRSIVNGCDGDNAGADTIVLEAGKTYVLSLHGLDDTNARGDLDITGPLTIRSSGPEPATIDAIANVFPGPPVGADRAIDALEEAGTVTLEGIRVVDGRVDWDGSAANGGGGVRTATSLTLRGTEVAFNHVEGNGEVWGGGVFVTGPNGRLNAVGSTIAGNSVLGKGPKLAAGGGIAIGKTSPELTMVNSTVSDNTSDGTGGNFGRAGGVDAGEVTGSSTVVNLTNVTITRNTGNLIGGLSLWRGTLTNSIVAGNTDRQPQIIRPDCYQQGATHVTSGGGNVIGDTGTDGIDCAFTGPGDVTGTHAAPLLANLGTLVNNGGPTRTRAPNPGSPAIDRGGSCPETDQRGFFRAPAAPCDAGAVEAGATADPPTEPPDDPPDDPPTGPQPQPPADPLFVAPPAPGPPAPPVAKGRTGKRARALAKCKGKPTQKARKRCRAKARKQPR